MSVEADSSRTLSDYGAILRRRWKLLVGIIPSTFLAAVFLAFVLPPLYMSSGTILLEPSSIPPELVKTTVISYADQQIELVQRTVMTAERLQRVVAKIDPYPGVNLTVGEKAVKIAENTSIEKVDPITLKPLPVSSAFSIYYLNPDPALAKAITREIAELFLQYNRETRTAQAKDAYAFLNVQSKQIEEHVHQLEQKVSEFKQRFGDALPDSRNRNELSLDRTQRDLDAAEAQVRVLEQQEQILSLQLNQINPMLVSSAVDSYTQLSTVRADLAAAQQKYTPDHPDVKRLTRALEALIALNKAGSGASPRPDNPEYLRVSSELNAVRRNLTAMRTSAGRARASMIDFENRLGASPTVERDYGRLTRDLELAQTEFAAVNGKLREAEVAETLESQAMGERYTLIREPNTPTSPSSPNRIGIILLGLLLGGIVAAALAIGREGSDPNIRGTRDVSTYGNLPLLGAIPTLLNHDDRRHGRLVLGAVAGAYSVAVIIVAIAMISAGGS